MAKPVLMTVDDDAEVLRAVERDLRERYAEKISRHARGFRCERAAGSEQLEEAE